jgi:hypothetical protein
MTKVNKIRHSNWTKNVNAFVCLCYFPKQGIRNVAYSTEINLVHQIYPENQSIQVHIVEKYNLQGDVTK